MFWDKVLSELCRHSSLKPQEWFLRALKLSTVDIGEISSPAHVERTNKYKMSEQMRSRSTSIGRRDEESFQLIEPFVDEWCSDDSALQEISLSETWDILSGQEIEDEEEPEDQGIDLEADLQEQTQPKTGGIQEDGLAVQAKFMSSLEYSQLPEADQAWQEGYTKTS
uniref:X antigen family member 3 n=1 Tax=Ictidomys tridecemlineatus TaxID=43179 RepID=UPI00067FEF78|nr:X antigen family member 3 [Ictidomys tridecemlineatus]